MQLGFQEEVLALGLGSLRLLGEPLLSALRPSRSRLLIALYIPVCRYL